MSDERDFDFGDLGSGGDVSSAPECLLSAAIPQFLHLHSSCCGRCDDGGDVMDSSDSCANDVDSVGSGGDVSVVASCSSSSCIVDASNRFCPCSNCPYNGFMVSSCGTNSYASVYGANYCVSDDPCLETGDCPFFRTLEDD